MRHRMDHRTLGRYGSHRAMMLSNMAASLFLTGQIKTTVTRAKELRRVAEKLITRYMMSTTTAFRSSSSEKRTIMRISSRIYLP